MGYLQAFLDQLILGAIMFSIIYYSRLEGIDDARRSLSHPIAVVLLFLGWFVLGTWLRYYWQMPIIGVLGYLFK